jgi:hypothetical protein
MRCAELFVATALLAAASGPAQTTPAPAAPAPPPAKWTEAQVRQAFEFADLDANGQLTRAEAQRLPVMPRPFEDLDSNKGGVLTVDELLAGFRG